MEKTTLIELNQQISYKIYQLRGTRVMLYFNNSAPCKVETKVLNKTDKRNSNRFSESFHFQLTEHEFDNLRPLFVTSSWGGKRYLPYAFS